MHVYDILMAVILVGTIAFGFVKGFAWQLASIASMGVSYFVAYQYREPISRNIRLEAPWNGFLAMLILFLGTSLVIWSLLNMVRGVIDRMKLKDFDRQIGAIFGAAKGILVCALVTLFSVSLTGGEIQSTIIGSYSGRWIARFLDQSDSIMPPELHAIVQPVLDRFDLQHNDVAGQSSWASTERLPEASVGQSSTPTWR